MTTVSSDSRLPGATGDDLTQRAEREWRHIFDAIGHPTVILDPQHGIEAANLAVQKASGKSEQELIGKRCYEVFHSPNAAMPVQGCPMEEMLRSGRLEAVDMEMEAFGGWYLVSCTPVLDETGRVGKIIHIATDITARTKAEESLREGEARYHELVDHMSSGVAVYRAVDDGADFVFRDFNLAGQRIEQTARADVIGRRVTEVFPAVKDFGLFDVLQRVWRTGTPERFPIALYKDERITGWRDNFVYKLPSGEVVSVYDDVTARKQGEQRLEHLNSVLRAVRNVGQLITREADRERLLRGVCDNLVEIRGYLSAWVVLLAEAGTAGLVVGSGFGERFDELARRAEGVALAPWQRKVVAEPGIHVFADPERGCERCFVAAMCSGKGILSIHLGHGNRVYGILAVCMPPDYATDVEEQGLFTEVADDIAYALRQIELGEQRQRTEQALRESEEKYRALFETMAEGVVYRDAAGNVISANPAAERILGVSLVDLLGRTSGDERWVAIREDGSPFSAGEHASMVALRTGRPVRNVIMGIHNPVLGARRWILVNTIPEFQPGETAPYRVYTTFADITERREATLALAEREARLTGILRVAPIGIGVVSNRVLKEVNERFCEMLGRSSEELVDQDTRILYPADKDYEFVGRKKYRQIAERGMGTVETRFQRKDGTIIDVLLSSTPIDPNDLSVGVTFTALDITERKRAEEALRASEDNYRSIFNAANDAIFVHEAETGRVLDVNAKMLEMFSCGHDEAITLNVEALSEGRPPHSQAEAAEWVRRAAQEEPQIFEWRSRRRDGSLFWTEVNLKRAQIGGHNRVLAVVRDITERKRAEEALRESRSFLENVIEHSPYAMWISDSEGTLIRANQALRDMFHLTDEDLVGRYNVFRDNVVEAQGAMPLIRKVYDEGARVRFTLEYDSARLRGISIREPASVVLDITVSAIRGPDGRVTNAIVQQIDITDHVRAERAVREQAEELARSNAELQQFAYVASHDLQEPLRKVSSYLHLLEERYRGRLGSAADEFIGFAVDGAQRMKRLINDLLEYSRVGTRGRPFEETDTDALLERVLADLQVAIEENRAEITHDRLPTVMADGVQLGQVFQNLITNALKFRREEPPRVQISVQERNDEWILSVSDNGIGLDREFRDRVFVMFQRLHGRGKYPGTGIGRAICKKIVERHGGRIWVESEPGCGSTFHFTLPAIRGGRS